MEYSPKRVAHTQVNVQHANDEYVAYSLHKLSSRSSGGECQRDYVQSRYSTSHVKAINIIWPYHAISLRYRHSRSCRSPSERCSEILGEHLLRWATCIAVLRYISNRTLRLDRYIQFCSYQLRIIYGVNHIDRWLYRREYAIRLAQPLSEVCREYLTCCRNTLRN